jgi:hypothetical protein
VAEGIGFFAVTAAVAFFSTLWGARRTVRVRPNASFGRHMACALLAFPTVAVLLFALATMVALVDGAQVHEPGPGAGMAIFAGVFFLIYALVAGMVVAVPTAAIMLRRLRG